MHLGKNDLNIRTWVQGRIKTDGLYAFLEYALCLQSFFQQNKTNVSFREIARLVARNPLSPADSLCKQFEPR